jgi:hypothetical protein
VARDEKAQSQLRPELFVPSVGSEVPDEIPEEWPEGWEAEDEPEGDYEEYEDEEWDDELYANEDTLDVDLTNGAAIGPVGVPKVFPASSSNRFGSFSTPEARTEVRKKPSKPRARSNGLKKGSLKKSKELDMPPTPLGCEWRDADGGWSLWRCWSERDEVIGGRFKKERYAGYLSREAWGVMKEYDYETFIAVIGRRFRRYGGR